MLGLARHFTKAVAPSKETAPRLSPQSKASLVLWHLAWSATQTTVRASSVQAWAVRASAAVGFSCSVTIVRGTVWSITDVYVNAKTTSCTEPATVLRYSWFFIRSAGGNVSTSFASRGRHECLVLQCGQPVWRTLFGMRAKLSASVWRPVDRSRPVLGHLITSTPIVRPRVIRCGSRRRSTLRPSRRLQELLVPAHFVKSHDGVPFHSFVSRTNSVTDVHPHENKPNLWPDSW